SAISRGRCSSSRMIGVFWRAFPTGCWSSCRRGPGSTGAGISSMSPRRDTRRRAFIRDPRVPLSEQRIAQVGHPFARFHVERLEAAPVVPVRPPNAAPLGLLPDAAHVVLPRFGIGAVDRTEFAQIHLAARAFDVAACLVELLHDRLGAARILGSGCMI